MKKMKLLSRALILCATGPLVACSADKVNIGNTNVIGSQLSDYAATWGGYAEAYTFQPDGSDRVRLTIDASGQGTLEFGNAALLASPTDPNVGSPPGTSEMDQIGSVPQPPQISEGFLYPIYATQVQADRIQLGINPPDLYAAWCALQPVTYASYATSFAHDAGYTSTVPGIVDGGVVNVSYNCIPNEGVGWGTTGGTLNAADGTTTPIDCGKLTLCWSHVCSCTASGCASPPIAAGTPVAQYPVELDGALDTTGATLTGTLTLGGQSGERITVHLTKQ